MKLAFLLCLVVGVGIQSVLCEGIHTQFGGSERCSDLSLHNLPVNSAKYRRLLILNGRQKDKYNSFKDCRVLSVKYVDVSSRRRSPVTRNLKRWQSIIKTPNNNFGYLQLKTFNSMPKNFQVIMELDCNGKKCYLDSVVNNADINNGPMRHQRKLLEVKSDNDDIQSFHGLSELLTVATVLTMVVVLAMCTCGKKNVKEAISDEIGGMVVDNNIVSLSSTDKSDDAKERRETANSNKSERLSTGENGISRPASQSSQEHDLTVDGAPRLNSTSSHSSGKKIIQAPPPSSVAVKVEDVSLKTSNPGASNDKDRARSQSTKEQSTHYDEPEDPKGFSQSDTFVYRGNEGNIASSSQGKKETVQPIIKKGSGKKENKQQEPKEKKKSWIRRKSSKHKENQPPKDDKKAGGRSSRHSEVPLPPTPDGVQAVPTVFVEEENQYEAVETRPRKIPSKPMGKQLPAVAEPARPSSELYASIEEENKRNSNGSHMYDMVETRKKVVPTKVDESGLEYAYAVVAPKDKPIKPTETSSGSGLYEVVSDDMKRNIPLDDEQDDDYAVVQKDNSKRKTTSQIARPLSDTNIIPAPPPVNHLPSQKQRAKSLGENLHEFNDNNTNMFDANQPFDPDHTYAVVNKQKKAKNNDDNNTSLGNNSSKPPSTKKDHTYAQVNKQKKTVHSNENEQTKVPSNTFVDVDSDSDEPPPIPPSLYAELPMKEGESGDARPSASDTNPPTTTTITNTESVVILTNEADKDHTVIQSQSSSRVVERTTQASSSNEQLSSQDNKGTNTKVTTESQGGNTVVISVEQQSSSNPLYDEIHYV